MTNIQLIENFDKVLLISIFCFFMFVNIYIQLVKIVLRLTTISVVLKFLNNPNNNTTNIFKKTLIYFNIRRSLETLAESLLL